MILRLCPFVILPPGLKENCLAKIRVLVVDDHDLVRQTLCSLVNIQPDMTVIAEAVDGVEAIRTAQQHKPDVVLLDIGLPGLSGLSAAGLIQKAAPNCEILIVTQYEEQFFMRHSLAVGARGFLTKTRVKAELISAIRNVFSKKQFVSGRTDVAETRFSSPDHPPT